MEDEIGEIWRSSFEEIGFDSSEIIILVDSFHNDILIVSMDEVLAVLKG